MIGALLPHVFVLEQITDYNMVTEFKYGQSLY